MSELEKRLANLSPEKRALLMQQLAKTAAKDKPLHEIGRRLRPVRMPLSSAQQRLWILDRFEPGNTVYNVTLLLRMVGPLNVEVLISALSEIVRRHETLRTVFVSDDDGPFQRILPAGRLPVAFHDVIDRPHAERVRSAMEIARNDAATSFDLANGPILRAGLVKIGHDDHLLMLSAHHIAVDGWSFGILAGELTQLYAAYIAGNSSPLPELPIQYADYTLWQRDEMDSDALRSQLDYWKTQFETIPPVLELPGDRSRPAVQSYRGELYRHVIPASVFDPIKRLARQEGATAFMVFLAAFQVLLSRYSGQDDLAIGVGNANRPRRELESLIGFFVNTLPLRGDLSGNPTFRDLLGQVKERTIDSYANQDMPFERLLESLDVGRNLSHTPLFQTMVFFQNFPEQHIDLSGLKILPVNLDGVHSGTSRTDLTIFASEIEGELTLLIEYATDLFDADYIRDFSMHLQQLLSAIVEDPSKRIAALEIMPPQQRKRVIEAWNATAQPLPEQKTVHALFASQVASRPEAAAVVQFDAAGTEDRLSYAELDAQADAIAAQLRARGCGPGKMVGLYLQRKPRMLAAMLGAWKAGAAYVPLDPSYPPERIAWMLEDSAAPVVLADPELIAELPQGGHEVLSIVDALASAAPASSSLASSSHVSAAGPEDTAYVIFTSGSTGRPKGVRVPHRAAVNFLASMARTPGLQAGETLCAITTLSFDIALLELMLPLTVGARVALADRATAADGEALAALLERADANAMQATPATWRMLLESGWRGRPQLRILCGGEGLPRDLAERLLRSGRELWNLYGPTETTVWSTVERIETADGGISIGTPIANTEVYIVDKQMQPLPPGIPGELLIGGLGVSQGYLDRPELTAEKFIADPFGPRAGGRLYRTGDLARWRRDGRIEVVGRIDHQVKLRGYRIELGEIESVLSAHPQVQQAVTICREDRPGDKRLVAYLTAAEGVAEIDLAELRAQARQRLPEYMMPSTIVVMDALPLTPNGKVDRRALPVPDADQIALDAYVAPRNAEEEQLATLWAEILGLPKIGIHDNFFNLGGHSLLATQLVARMQKAIGRDIALRMLFEAPTIAEFAELLLRKRMQNVDADALASMLQELEGLSEADIQSLLAN
jgi:amino acid adenylation domain-containing protein